MNTAAEAISELRVEWGMREEDVSRTIASAIRDVLDAANKEFDRVLEGREGGDGPHYLPMELGQVGPEAFFIITLGGRQRKVTIR